MSIKKCQINYIIQSQKNKYYLIFVNCLCRIRMLWKFRKKIKWRCMLGGFVSNGGMWVIVGMGGGSKGTEKGQQGKRVGKDIQGVILGFRIYILMLRQKWTKMMSQEAHQCTIEP